MPEEAKIKITIDSAEVRRLLSMRSTTMGRRDPGQPAGSVARAGRYQRRGYPGSGRKGRKHIYPMTAPVPEHIFPQTGNWYNLTRPPGLRPGRAVSHTYGERPETMGWWREQLLKRGRAHEAALGEESTASSRLRKGPVGVPKIAMGMARDIFSGVTKSLGTAAMMSALVPVVQEIVLQQLPQSIRDQLGKDTLSVAHSLEQAADNFISRGLGTPVAIAKAAVAGKAMLMTGVKPSADQANAIGKGIGILSQMDVMHRMKMAKIQAKIMSEAVGGDLNSVLSGDEADLSVNAVLRMITGATRQAATDVYDRWGGGR